MEEIPLITKVLVSNINNSLINVVVDSLDGSFSDEDNEDKDLDMDANKMYQLEDEGVYARLSGILFDTQKTKVLHLGKSGP